MSERKRRIPPIAVAAALTLGAWLGLAQLAGGDDFLAALGAARHGRAMPLLWLAAFLLVRLGAILLLPGLLIARLGLALSDHLAARRDHFPGRNCAKSKGAG